MEPEILPVRGLREHPEMQERFIAFFASHWGNEAVYRDCMTTDPFGGNSRLCRCAVLEIAPQ